MKNYTRWEPGTRIRIKKHDHVGSAYWGRRGSVLADTDVSNGLYNVGVVHLLLDINNEKVKLWGDQIEVDVLGELASI